MCLSIHWNGTAEVAGPDAVQKPLAGVIEFLAAGQPIVAWTELTRTMFGGLYRDYALGAQEDRCFTHLFSA